MKALNLLWYLYYRFTLNTCKRKVNDAKWSATLATSVSISLITDILIKLFCYNYNYSLFVRYWYGNIIPYLFIAIGAISIGYFYGIQKVKTNVLDNIYTSYSLQKRRYLWIVFSFVAIAPLILDLMLIFFIKPEML